MNTTNTTYDEHVTRAISLTQYICETWSSRLAGTTECLESANHIQGEMEKFCDSVKAEEFEVHPGAFLGYIRVLVVLYFVSLFALWQGYYGFLFAITTFCVVLVVAEFFIYKEFIDPLFPKKTGKNIVGIIEPTGEVRQQIIISGHHDSAHIFNFFVHQPKLYVLRILGSMSATFIFAIFGILLFGWDTFATLPESLVTVSKYLFAFFGLFVIQMWFFYSSKGTPGAGDNMASSATAMEVGRFFQEEKTKGKGLKHTRVIVGSWDAEEAGLRGARAYVKAHKEELLQIPSYNFNIECLYDSEKLFFLTSDLNNFVKLSEEMATDCKNVASELGHTTGLQPFPFAAGGTDAAEFAKIGVKATTIFGMGFTADTKPEAYHTLKDTIDSVDPKAIAITLDIGINYIRKKEREISLS